MGKGTLAALALASVVHGDGAHDLRVAAGAGGARSRIPDGDRLKDDEHADQADRQADHHFDERHAALRGRKAGFGRNVHRNLQLM